MSEAHGEVCRTDPCERCMEAMRRTREALEHIERAQIELYEACSKLSSLCGALPMWNRAGKLGDQVKALWHRVNSHRDAFTLDDMSKVRQ